MKIDKSGTGVYRIRLPFGWAVGVSSLCPEWVWLEKYRDGGWSLRILWFHIGRQ